MGSYVYVYQEEALNCTLKNYNRGCPLPTPTRQSINAAIHFKDRIMGPVHLYNMVNELCMIFGAALIKEESSALSYCQASNLIIFLHLWRRFKGKVSNLMRVMMKQWKLPTWAFKNAKKKKEHLCDERW